VLVFKNDDVLENEADTALEELVANDADTACKT
jgi:hypothetical protein